MTELERTKLDQLIREGYPHSSGACLFAGWQLYRSRFRDFALFSLVVPMAGSVLGALGLGWTGTLLLTFLIAPVLNAGFYLVTDRILRQQEVKFAHFFEGRFKALPLILNNLVAVLISAVILIPTYLLLEKAGMLDWWQEAAENPTSPPEPPLLSGSASTTLFLNILPLVYLQVGFSWAYPFILFYGANPFQGLEWSRRLVTRRWWPQFMLLLTLVSLFMMASFVVAGLAAFSVGLMNIGTFGLFLILPLAYCSLYAGFYQTTTPLREEMPLEE